MSEGVSPVNLVPARSALDQVSRAEIVNLMVDDYLVRLQDEIDAVKRELDAAYAALDEALDAFYEDVRADILFHLKPKADVIRASLQGLGLTVREPSFFNMPDASSRCGFLRTNEDRYPWRQVVTLPQKLMKTWHPPSDGPWFVEISFAVEVPDSVPLYHNFQVPWTPPELSDHIRMLQEQVSEIQARCPSAPDEKALEGLRRKALAALTRKALVTDRIDVDFDIPKLLLG